MNVAAMSLGERLKIVFEKVAVLLPGDAGRRLLAMLSPESLASIAVVVARRHISSAWVNLPMWSCPRSDGWREEDWQSTQARS